MARSRGSNRPTAPPFTGRDLLDQVYGYVLPQERQLFTCSCPKAGNGQVRSDPTCSVCRLERETAGAPAWDDLSRYLEQVQLDGSVYEFFANRWWKVDGRNLRDHVVRNPDTIHKLDQLADRLPKKPPPVEKMQYAYLAERAKKKAGRRFRTVVVETPAGPLQMTARGSEIVCTCSSEASHDAFPGDHAGLGTVCKVHGTLCDTCGEDHVRLSGRVIPGITD